MALRAVCNVEQSREVSVERAAETSSAPANGSAERSIASRRAEEALARWRAAKPRPVKARDVYTRLVSVEWERLQRVYGNAYSVGAVARSCAVSESTARQWRKGEAPIPPWAISFLPARLREAVLAIVGGGVKDEVRKVVGQ